jgi:radical SAM superfamily enzyme YgiQ (UPF0313 family)
MRIFLVTPANPPSYWTYDAILPTLDVDCLFPNLSMPTVAGLTPPEHEVVLCDENVEEIDFDFEADIVGVTGFPVHRPRILEIVEEFRRRGRFVVVGGPFASLFPDELQGRCDALFVEEAEETWPQFLRDFEAGVPKSEYRSDQKPDLRNSPMPRFDLLKIDRYHALTIQFARGCPFNCEFCDIITMYGRKPRMKNVEQVMAEIRECHRLGSHQIFIVDDNFIGNKKIAKELLREIARFGRENDYSVDFNTEVSIDVSLDDELLGLLREANFTTLFIGIESPRVESLKETRKHQNLREDLVKSVRKVQSYGIQVQAGMIVGFDHDDPSIFEEQIQFIEEARIPVSMTGMLQAVPKTPLHARLKQEGRLAADFGGDQFAFSNVIPKRMTRVELFRGYRRLLERLYSFRSYRRRTLGFLLNRGAQIKQGRVSLHPGDLRLLGRILRETVLRGGVRRAGFTLSLLGETLLRRPRLFKDAVSFAILHKAFDEYMRGLGEQLDRAIAALESEAVEAAEAD